MKHPARLLWTAPPLLLACLWALGCAGAPPAPAAGPAPAARPPAPPWAAPHGQDHPLTGRIRDRAAGRFVSPEALIERLRGARFVLLGEQHDHPDHHRLQAWILQEVLRDRAGAVAFEMLDADQAPALAALPPGAPPAAVAEAVGWARSRWPDFALYAPIFEAARAVGARLLAAHPDRARLKAVMTAPPPTTPEARAALGLGPPLPGPAAADLEAQIVASHCGHAPGALLAPMALAQQLKDAWMARQLAAARAEAVILIAGNGHVRADRGVPYFLAAPGETLSVGLIEVDPDTLAPEAYDAAAVDYLWFTPRLDLSDPCERFREQLKRLGPARPEAG